MHLVYPKRKGDIVRVKKVARFPELKGKTGRVVRRERGGLLIVDFGAMGDWYLRDTDLY